MARPAERWATRAACVTTLWLAPFAAACGSSTATSGSGADATSGLDATQRLTDASDATQCRGAGREEHLRWR